MVFIICFLLLGTTFCVINSDQKLCLPHHSLEITFIRYYDLVIFLISKNYSKSKNYQKFE